MERTTDERGFRPHGPLLALLDYLDATMPHVALTWQQWSIAPIAGGANNLLYRVTRSGRDYAVKFAVRDDRNRAGREYAALAALHHAGLELAPQPIWVDHDRYRQPVMVQTWLDGEALTAPPQTDGDWEALLRHYCAIHSLTPSQTTVAIADAVHNAASGSAGRELVHQHVARLPPEARPASLLRLLAWFDDWTPPTWPEPPRTLCRVDPNWQNFIRRPHGWASVDWENSGWGDPAFELADLLVHPAYEGVPMARRQELSAGYAQQMEDPTADVRIQTYYTVLLMWWVVRWARYLYEVPRGLDPRLVARPTGWQEHAEREYAQYLARTEEHFESLST